MTDSTNETIIPDNADDIFEPEPDSRTELDKALEAIDPESQNYLKALFALQETSFNRLKDLAPKESSGVKVVQVWNPPDCEYLAKSFSIFDPKAEGLLTTMLNDGWQLVQTVPGPPGFMGIFRRPKSLESKVPYTSDQVADLTVPEGSNPKVPEA